MIKGIRLNILQYLNFKVMCNRDKNGFMIVAGDEDLQLAKIKGEVSVSVECKCCGRQLIMHIENIDLSCKERKELKIYSI